MQCAGASAPDTSGDASARWSGLGTVPSPGRGSIPPSPVRSSTGLGPMIGAAPSLDPDCFQSRLPVCVGMWDFAKRCPVPAANGSLDRLQEGDSERPAL